MNATTVPAILAPVIAHRGASGHAPENTLAALSLAADHGAKCVEIDVSISADRVAFVHHDDTLDRCTTGTGLLCEHQAADLDKLDASKGMAAYTGEPLPRLDAVIELLVKRGLGLNLEIKPYEGLEETTVDVICTMIEQRWPDELPLVFSSFNRTALEAAMKRLPAVPRGLLVEEIPDNWPSLIAAYACRNIHCDGSSLTGTQAQQLRAADLGVYCYTVNDSQQAKLLIDSGVHGVFTDYPQRLLSELQS